MKQRYVSAKLYNMYGYGAGNKLQYYHTDWYFSYFTVLFQL